MAMSNLVHSRPVLINQQAYCGNVEEILLSGFLFFFYEFATSNPSFFI